MVSDEEKVVYITPNEPTMKSINKNNNKQEG